MAVISINTCEALKKEFCGRTSIYFSDWILSWVWLGQIFFPSDMTDSKYIFTNSLFSFLLWIPVLH